MKIKKVNNETDLEFIISSQVLMAKETEGMELDESIVRMGVHNLYKSSEFGDYYIAYSEDKPVGCLLTTYEWSDWRNGICLWIQSVYILPEFRKQGIFKSMYAYLKTIVEDSEKYTGLRLYVDKTNTSAQEVYKRVGMTKEHYELYKWLK